MGLHSRKTEAVGPRATKEILLTWTGILVTLAAVVLFALDALDIFRTRAAQGDTFPIVEQVVFLLIVLVIVYGNLVYQFTRIGYFHRLERHRPAGRDELDRLACNGSAPSLSLLVPSYKEEPSVVRMTLLSAALQEYPRKRVVLLIDDPPTPASAEDEERLQTARNMPAEIEHLLRPRKLLLDAEKRDFENRRTAGRAHPNDEARRLATLYAHVAAWFERQAGDGPARDHVEKFFIEKTLREPATAYGRKSEELAALAGEKNAAFDLDRAAREYARLVGLFAARLTRFERKRCVNLSHEPNKAMNINSYIALMGKRFRRVAVNGGYRLEEAAGGGDVAFPDSEYIITLDADSLLFPDYARKLIHVMEQPEHRNLAVAQTPYSAFPGTSNQLERIAGATTDIQYIIHQGFTYYDATFWVGANALLRKKALEDIRFTEREGSLDVVKYIQDRTVIEDTESSVDLVHRGWKLLNYPERLAFSATPTDFGSLIIQRRRWANGGLIIFPKLLRYILHGVLRRNGRLAEGLVRTHYLLSTAAVSLGLLMVILYPFEECMRTWWLPLSALPYFYFYGRDLAQTGYRMSDMWRVYALNLMLVPVNLAGAAKSVRQMWTGERISFGRTPKVQGRTAAPAFYLLSEGGILLYSIFAFTMDSMQGFWMHAVFSLLNVSFFVYVFTRLIGWRAYREDFIAWRQNRWISETVADTPGQAANSNPRPVVVRQRRRAAPGTVKVLAPR